MKVKETDLGTFKACPGENGKLYYHDSAYDYLDSEQSYTMHEVSNSSNEMVVINNRQYLVFVSYPDGEWVTTGKMIPRESGIISDPERVFNNGEPERFMLALVLEICERCKGKGTMGNPAFNGTSIEWWQESGGPDWQEDLNEYIHGDLYDVQCEFHCDQGKAWGIDWTYIIEQWKDDPRVINDYATKIRQLVTEYYDYLAERASEERWGY